MSPSWIWFLGMTAATAFLLAPIPLFPGYFKVVPWGLHLLMCLLAMGAVMMIARCRTCGRPMVVSVLADFGWLPKRCSGCGEPL